MVWFLYCNTGSLRKHKPYVPCSVLLSNNYVIKKACGLAYGEKVNLKVLVRLFFQGLPSFLGKEKSAKYSYFLTDVVLSILPFENSVGGLAPGEGVHTMIVTSRYWQSCPHIKANRY